MTENLDTRVAPSNADQAKAWDGDEGAYWAANADHYDRSVADYHGALLDAAAIAPADRIVDIGCGTGQTTRDAARLAPSGSALGVDLSSRMLEVARRRAAAEVVPNARFERADAQGHSFDPAHDVALSRTGTMFFGDPESAFANIATALRPGGRLAVLTWQPATRNEWILSLAGALAVGRDLPLPPPDAPGPFSQSDPDRLRSLLTGAGFAEVTIAPAHADMWFGDDAEDARRFVLGQLGWMLEGLDEAGRRAADEALRATVTAHAGSDGVRFGSAAWLTTAVRA